MTRSLDLSVVIPAYNEESRLARTVREIVAHCRGDTRAFELILVDDGSRDGTSAVGRLLCQEFPELRLIRLAANHGKGYAVRTGVINAVGHTVLFDDRPENAGVKFNDADLVGYPVQVVVGRRGIEAGTAELKLRSSGARSTAPLAEAVEAAIELLTTAP